MRPFPLITAICFFLTSFFGAGQANAQRSTGVVMLSDIHFDPFRDPAKLPALRQQPVAEWAAVLSSVGSPTQAADTAALQESCHSRALDSGWDLLRSALQAAHDETPKPSFLLVPGDLLAHEFRCRYMHLVPAANVADSAAFAAKTITFVLAQLQATFPQVPVYATLGNNDSGCGDYRETPGDPFMVATAGALAEAAHVDRASLSPLGDYTALLPVPFQKGRLIVLEDNFDSRQFSTCAAAQDRTPEQQQLEWLRGELTKARSAHEHVWVMAHLPPGVNVYASFRQFIFKPAALCSATPQAFLADPALADTLLDFADVVQLALFGHTHVDEMRVLQRDAVPGASTGAAVISVKIVPAVSPFIGNHPSFLSATVDTRSLMLKDWRTLVSPGPLGSTPPWAEGYRFTTAYHLPDFSADSALQLANHFVADPKGETPDSTTFRQHFFPGDIGLYAIGLGQIWPAYACSVRENRPSAVHRCICNAAPMPSQP